MSLTEYDEEYEKAEIREGGNFPKVPDGKYQVTVNTAKVKINKAGAPMLSWGLKVMSGDFEGYLLWKNSNITKESIPYIKTDLSLCGILLEKFSDLPDETHQLLDIILNVTKKTRKDAYQDDAGLWKDSESIYINSRVELSAGGKDDIPF